jgi:hypothetical protein
MRSISLLTETRSFAAKRLRARQKASSRVRLVRCPAISTERFLIVWLTGGLP